MSERSGTDHCVVWGEGVSVSGRSGSDHCVLCGEVLVGLITSVGCGDGVSA